MRRFGRSAPIRDHGESWFPSEEERELREARTVEMLARAKADRTADRADRVLTWLEGALIAPDAHHGRQDGHHLQ